MSAIFFAVDVLSVIYAFYVRDGFRVAILIQFASFSSYLPFLFNQEPVSRWLLPLPILLAIALVIRHLAGPVTGNTTKYGGQPC